MPLYSSIRKVLGRSQISLKPEQGGIVLEGQQEESSASADGICLPFPKSCVSASWQNIS